MSQPETEQKLTVFNGAMASGKTTQARLWARETGAHLLLGDESTQPEIVSGEVYTQGSDVEVEKWFVDYHCRRLGELAMLDTPQRVVSDMSSQNDLIWGRALLSGKELEEFEVYYRERTAGMPLPDHSILFLLPTAVLLDRVRSRAAQHSNRAFEKNTKLEFIEKIQGSFIDSSDELAKNVKIIDLREESHLPVDEVHQRVRDVMQQLA
jgi:deoxyadenosine/deoxycytidine kinase